MIRENIGALARAWMRLRHGVAVAGLAGLALLSACGGGGSAASDPPVDINPPPPATVSLALTGTAADGLLPDAQVAVRVGSRTQTVAAGADGRYRAEITGADEGDWVTLQVTSAARPDVVLRSVAGRLGNLVVAAGAGTALDASQWPALDVGAASTAATLIATRENGGTEPADMTTLLALRPWISLDESVTLAVGIRRGVALNVPLPTPGSGLLATLSAPRQAQAWFRAVSAADTEDLDNAVTATIEALATEAPAEGWAVAGQRVVYDQHGVSPADALVVDYRANGEAVVQMPTGTSEATWVRTADAVQLTLLRPIDVQGFADPDPDTGIVYPVVDRLTGLTLRQVRGWDGVLRITRQGVRRFLDGPRYNEEEPLVLAASTSELFRPTQLGSAQTLAASEFADGTRWAGFIDSAEVNVAIGAQDVFTMTAGNAVSQLSGRTFTLTLAGNRLSLATGGDLPADYLRLRRHPLSGEQVWLRLNLHGHPGSAVTTLSVVPLSTSPSFDDAGMVGDWAWSAGFLREFRADHTGIESFSDALFSVQPERALTWQLREDGTFEMRRTLSASRTRVRTWQGLQTRPIGTWVLETLIDERTGVDPLVQFRSLRLQRKL